jgi:hypothetical protein
MGAPGEGFTTRLPGGRRGAGEHAGRDYQERVGKGCFADVLVLLSVTPLGPDAQPTPAALVRFSRGDDHAFAWD